MTDTETPEPLQVAPEPESDDQEVADAGDEQPEASPEEDDDA